MSIAVKNHSAAILERVVVRGDLSGLNPQERMEYYRAICASVGLNPLTRPFDYLHLSGKLVLYAKRDATDQLRKIHGVSIERLERETVEASMLSRRTPEMRRGAWIAPSAPCPSRAPGRAESERLHARRD